MAASGDSNSDMVEITKNMAHVNVATNNEADEADFSAYLWIADSGVTTHICNNQSAFEEYTILTKKVIRGISNVPVTAYGRGTILLDCRVDGTISQVWLHEVLHVPDARENILSLPRIDVASGRATFENGQINIYDASNKKIMTGTLRNQLYYLEASVKLLKQVRIAMTHTRTWAEWH